MPTEEESKWEEVAKAYDDGKGLPLEGVNPDDKETMNEVYGALKVNNIGAKARLNRFIRRLRQQPVLPPVQEQQPQLSQFSETAIADLTLMAEEANGKKENHCTFGGVNDNKG